MEPPSATPQPIDQPPAPENPNPLPVTPTPPSTTSTTTTTTSSPNLAPIPTTISATKPPISPQTQATHAFNSRPWQPQVQGQPSFSLPSPPLPSSSPASAAPSSVTPRGGMAIGVPAHHPSASPTPPASFSSLAPPSYGAHQSQTRQPIQGIGMTGALGTTTAIRQGAMNAHQLRPAQSPIRPQGNSSSQSPISQNFQGPGMLRPSAMGSPVSPSAGSSQNQPWLHPGPQGKPPVAPSNRPQASPQSFQQRSHIPQQHLPNMPPTTAQQHPISSSIQMSQSPASAQPHEHPSQQFPASRTQQSLSHQQQIVRGPGLASQRGPPGMAQTGVIPPSGPNKVAIPESEEVSNRILTKRSIQELVNQIDPSEKLDPEVEDILVDIAEDFVESITTFGCSLAKHRKSNTLEAKDVLLHLERNWNMTLPGFGAEDIKTYKKSFVSDIHRERIAAVRKSVAATEVTTKNSGGTSGVNAKGHLARAPVIGSPPNPKIRETA